MASHQETAALKGETVYLAILEDRHIDTVVEVFSQPFHALKQITEWQHGYKDRYEWIQEEINGWDYSCYAEDGPKMRIVSKELK